MPDFRSFLPGLLVFSFLVVTGCEEHDEVILPSDEELVELIYDLHSAESTLSRVYAGHQDSIAAILRERVAASHGTTPEQMDIWLEALQRSPEHLEAVYDSVIVRFERQRAAK